MKEIPKKNYIILLGLSIGTIILLVYISSLYKSYQLNKDKDYEIQTVLSTITIDDLDNYIQENPNVIIYISKSDNELIDIFEIDFKKYIKEKELSSEIVYLNTSNIAISDRDKIAAYFNDEFKRLPLDLLDNSNLLLFKDGKIVDIMYLIKKDIDIKDVKLFLEKNNIQGDENE